MRKYFLKHIQGKKILIIFLLTNLVYCSMLFFTIPQVIKYANGMDLLDMMPAGYRVDYVQALLETLGPNGRNAYRDIQLPVDMIYPFLFGLSYSLILAYFLYQLTWMEKPVFYIVLLPMVAGLFDYAENIGIFTMLQAYPDFSKTLASVTNIFTIVKSATSTISFIVLLILVMALLVRKMKLH